MSKTKNPSYTSPKGILAYPYLNTPDTKFVEEGVFKADLIVDAEEAEPLIKQLDKQLDNFIKQMEKETGKRQNRNKFRLPYEDHEEDETKIVFKMKQSAKIKGRSINLLYYDANKNKVVKPPLIRGGSVVKIAGTSRPYVKGTNKGLTLSIIAIQMIELNEGDASTLDVSAFDFEEEEGFIADETPLIEEPDDFEDESDFDDDGDF